MEEPFHSIQDVAETTASIQSDPDNDPARRFLLLRLQLDRLIDIKQKHPALPADWRTILSHTEESLHAAIREARAMIPKEAAVDLSIHTQARNARHTQNKVDFDRSLRAARVERRRWLMIAGGMGLILLTVAATIGFYQWQMLMSDEGWFHDIRERRWGPVERRVAVGKSIDTRDHVGRSAVHFLARDGDVEGLRRLKALGADLLAVDQQGWTALHYAAAAGRPAAVEWLADQGLDLNAADNEGVTPLHALFAKAPGSKESVQALDLLLARGSRIDTAAPSESSFMAAILWVRGAYFERSISILEDLINKGADVNFRGANGSTPLSHALARYLPDTPDPEQVKYDDPIIRLLLDSGAVYEQNDFSLPAAREEPERLQFVPGMR